MLIIEFLKNKLKYRPGVQTSRGSNSQKSDADFVWYGIINVVKKGRLPWFRVVATRVGMRQMIPEYLEKTSMPPSRYRNRQG